MLRINDFIVTNLINYSVSKDLNEYLAYGHRASIAPSEYESTGYIIFLHMESSKRQNLRTFLLACDWWKSILPPNQIYNSVRNIFIFLRLKNSLAFFTVRITFPKSVNFTYFWSREK